MVEEMVVRRAKYEMTRGTGNTKYSSASVLDLNIDLQCCKSELEISPLLHHSAVCNRIEEMVFSRAKHRISHGTGNTRHGGRSIVDLNVKTYNVLNLK